MIARDWICRECSRTMTIAQAERASMSDRGCPGCGGADIDLATTAELALAAARAELHRALATERKLIDRCETSARAMTAAQRAADRTNAAYRAIAALEGT